MSRKKIDKTPKKKNINIKYLAKVAGVSPSTVSRALRGDPNANKKTADRILDIAKELNYYQSSCEGFERQKNEDHRNNP